MSGPKCTTYRRDRSLTAAALRAAARDAAVREAIRRREEAVREAALQAAAARDAAVRRVKARNARITALSESSRGLREQYGDAVNVRLPEPLRLSDQSTSQLESWCVDADRALATAERELRDQAARATAADLFADVTGRAAERRLIDAADLFAGRTAASGAVVSEVEEEAAREDMERTLTRVLSRLLPDCGESLRTEVQQAAARVTEAATLDEARTWLTETRLRVQRANAAAEARRREAGEAIELLQDLEYLENATSADVESVRTLLGEVVAGRRPLDEPLLRQAAACQAMAEAEAEQQYVVNTVTDVLSDLGYQVTQGFETVTVTNGTLRLARAEWREHAVNLVVDQQNGQMRTAVVRTVAGGGDDSRHVDVEREEQWCQDFHELRGRLAQAGLSTDIQVAVPPGQVPVPLAVSPLVASPRTTPRHRKRDQ